MSVPLTADNLLIISAFPGFNKWEKGTRFLLLRPTGANIAHIVKHWTEATWDGEAIKHMLEYQGVQQQLEETAAQKKIVLTDDDGYEYKMTPWHHQRQAFLLSRDRENFALLMEQRTGKTKVTLDTAAYRYHFTKDIDALVVVAKNGVHRNWIETEIPKHLPDWCPVSATWNAAQMPKYRMEEFESIIKAKHSLRVIAFNVEGFVSKQNQYLFEKCQGEMRCMTVVDESTRIKNQSALRSKYLIKEGKNAVARRILTGTPVTKGVQDLYAQFLFLDPMILGYDSFYTYKNNFCEYVTITPKDSRGKPDPRHAYDIYKGFKNIEELYRVLDGCSYRVRRSEVFDAPPKVYKRWPVELTPKQKKIYGDLVKEFIAECDAGMMTAPLAMVRSMRLLQICCNWFASDDDKIPVPIEAVNPRLKVLVNDILDEIDGKVIIWARFKADLDAIKAALGDKAVTYYGDGSNDNKRAENERRFKTDPEVLYMIANPQSAAWGLDWSVAETEVFYSNFDDLELRLQAEDRPVNATNRVLVIDMEAPRTVESKVILSLQSKNNVAELINRDPRSFFLEEMEETVYAHRSTLG